ncbi:hypothetical protein HUJ04_006717 [Dendroctonus ponderosae]|nr:hypothetical protein HUJ04_006717 [Dendroctonus ponderosae]
MTDTNVFGSFQNIKKPYIKMYLCISRYRMSTSGLLYFQPQEFSILHWVHYFWATVYSIRFSSGLIKIRCQHQNR